MNILLQAIKLAPRLLWQSLFQPSKAYEFAHESEKNGYILILSSFLWGLGLGIVLAIPHYLLYHDVVGSVSFLFAVALVIAFAVAFTSASANVDAFKVEGVHTHVCVYGLIHARVSAHWRHWRVQKRCYRSFFPFHLFAFLLYSNHFSFLRHALFF